MKNIRSKPYILVIAACIACVFIAVTAFRGFAADGKDASYYLLYNAKGSAFNAYVQTKAGVKSYQYKQTMQTYGDLIGDDRTADLHEIEKPKDASGDILLDTAALSLSKDVKEQFFDLQKNLLSLIEDSFKGSGPVASLLTSEVNERVERISEGNLSYLIPLDSYLELDHVVYDEKNPDKVASAEVKTFLYKKKSNVAIVDGEADFSEKDMTSALMWDRNLKNISFSKSWLCQTIFAECDLTGGNMAESVLLGSVIVGCDLSECDLSKTNLSGTTFAGTDMSGANLDGALFEGTKFKKLGSHKVKIDRKWKEEILAGYNVEGIDHVEWV